ncbi:MAG: transcriptional regulator [Sphingomicrobium sp.]
MNVERSVGTHRIGGWEFLLTSGELRRRTDIRRLEPRAAKVLEILCEADGELVSQDQLIAEVWSGRSLSENSVAVVIGQLRRMLDDDARLPRLIETIPKRGYRLIRQPEPPRPRDWMRLGKIACGLLLLLAVAVLVVRTQAPAPPSLVVADVVNATGDKALDAHSRATSELIVDQLTRRGFAVRRRGSADLSVESKLVMWNGAPSLGINAIDRAGSVHWSAMMPGGPAQVPGQVDTALDGFEISLAKEAARR